MKSLITCIVFLSLCLNVNAQKTVWKIGEKNKSSSDLSLGPSGYKEFLANNFGFEDKFYLIGRSRPEKDFPYVLPGPDDTWGGTWNTSGWRTHEINILFGIDKSPGNTQFKLRINLLDSQSNKSLFKVTINNRQSEKFLLKGESDTSLDNPSSSLQGKVIEIPINKNILREGGNNINLTILEGSWVVFDNVELVADKNIGITQPEKVFVRDVEPAGYELSSGDQRFQPLLVDIEHLEGQPEIKVELDNQEIFSSVIDTARYQFEVLMPAVKKKKTSKYNILIDGKSIAKGNVVRTSQKLQTLADYVDTKIGTAHSRWMIAPGPWMPFSMVKMSPDNQNMGWQAGYQPSFETVGCFSHIHEWTMGGLGLMPTNGVLQTKVGDQFDPDSGYRSRIDKLSEEAPLGHYKVHLTDTDIWAEVTATTRAGFQRYTFPQDRDGRVMIDLHIQAEYDYKLLDVLIRKVSDYRIEGYSTQVSNHVWSEDEKQEYTVHFVIEFDRPIKKVGGWLNDNALDTDYLVATNPKDAGMYVEFDTKESSVVQVRSGISLVSIENAGENLKKEIAVPFGWDYNAIVENQKKAWNDILDRLKITTNDRLEKVRFYSNMYRGMSRNTWSDVNGEWKAADGRTEKLSNPDHLALGCDAFWNSFWNLNQYWNLIAPEWSSKWVNSQLAMYDANGWLAKGPAGMKYIPVMVAEHEIPLIVGAYQMGIRDFDAEKALEAMKKMQTTPPIHLANGFAGNRDLVAYMKYKYVPSDLGRFSNTMEYSYNDWTVSQFAKSLGKMEDYRTFADRGQWWKNAINPANGYAHMRERSGKFVDPFDPFKSGANHQYVEANAWQMSYFVPQDVPALAKILGEKDFVERLDWGFKASEPWRYNAPNDQYWDYPVVQGNQQSMHFAFLFNWVNRPWLTQRWSRSIIDNYYGCGLANAYLGDEDQGQMSSWFVMASIGLFQTDGGCHTKPIYEIGSPLFEKIVIDLGQKYGRGKEFTIEAKNASRKNKYIQSATLNGRPLKTFWFPASELLKGGALILEMGDTPNQNWGLGLPDANR